MGTGDEHQGKGIAASSLGYGHLTDGHRSRNIWSPAATAHSCGELFRALLAVAVAGFGTHHSTLL